MKVRLLTRSYRRVTGRIHAAYPEGLSSPDALKRQVSLIDLMAFYTRQEPERIDDNKVQFHCWRTSNHTNGDEHASLWVYDDYHGTGFGRWGCPVCYPEGGDVIDFLKLWIPCSWRQALWEVKAWSLNHRGAIRIRLRREQRHVK